jgi:hypothetical protein
MALENGYRFAVAMGDAFAHGLYAMGVEQAMDFNESTRARTPAKDKQTQDLVWTVTCIDREPEIRGSREVKIKVLASHCPVLPPEIVPDSGIRPVEFSGLTVTAYVSESGGRARLAYSFRATGVHQQGRAPGQPGLQNRPAGQPVGEHKAA